ncbi:zinc finger, CCHC-type containing protein [Tanacetum coccineum]
MKNQANLKRRELTFQVGDYVFLKIQPYRQKSLAKRRYEKLSPRFFGPYPIKRTVGPVAYELELPPEAKIHPVFHVSMPKLARGSFSSVPAALLPITKDWEIDLQPSSVITHRWVYEAGCPNLELLVSWCNRPIEESTWETYDLVAEQFPAFCLEDKAFDREGSSDKDPLKDEALDKFKVFKTEVKLQQGSLIKRFRTDRGGEYIDTLYFWTESRVLRAVVRLPDPKLKTLDERGIKCIFVGYAEHSKTFRFYVIKPNDSISINSTIESRDAIFNENRFSSVPGPSQRSLVNGTEEIGYSVVPEDVTEEVVQQPEPELRKGKRKRTPKDFGPEFQLYLIEGTRDEVSDQQSYCSNVEDDPKIFDEEMKS